ncbi:MADF domain-containing protein, partial [Aphis craccivora]
MVRKTHDVIGEVILNELISSRPKTPPLTTTPSVTDSFCTYLMETMKNLPNNIKIQWEGDILALVFAAKKSTVQKI